jgi:hypothetical protein
MPSRRLPQSDKPRGNALSQCGAVYAASAAADRLITPAQMMTLTTLQTPWVAANDALGPLLFSQTQATTAVLAALAVSARVNSQFIQVLNFAIERGALPANTRTLYKLPASHAEVPPMTTTLTALDVAADLAKGEADRIAAGGTPFAWPAIGEVTADATALRAAETAQNVAKLAYDRGQEAVAQQRSALDAFIKKLWDTIEFNLSEEEPASLRRKAREWGVTYEGDPTDDDGGGSGEPLTALAIESLSYNSSGASMQINYAPTGGETATTRTLLWRQEGGAEVRIPLTHPTQEVPLPGISGITTYWRVEVTDGTTTLTSPELSYYID